MYIVKKILAVTALVVAMLMPNMAVAETGPMIIVFDVDRAIALSKAGKSVAEQLKKQMEDVRAGADKQRETLQGDINKLQEQRSLLAADALKGKVEELQQKELKMRQELQIEVQSVQAGGQRAGQQILKLAEEELASIAKDRKADIVMRRDAVFFASPSIDVTNELISRLDKKLKTVKVTPVKAESKN
ncbi:MAG: OmpH family outer membrane protein [Parvibaculales bacterium]